MASEGRKRQDTLPAREQILDAAFELFATDGIRQTTLSDVAARARVQEGEVREHFDGVDELLLAVLERMDSSFIETENYVAGGSFSGIEVLRRLSATAKILVDRPLHTKLRVVVSFEAIVREGAARTYTQERTENIRWWFAAVLTEGVRLGEFSPDTDPDARATEMVAFMEGIQIQWLLHPDRIDLVRAYESYMDDLLDQICVPEDIS